MPFFDLTGQQAALHDEISAAIDAVLRKAAFTGGPFVEEFENGFADFLGARHFAGVSSGSDALFLALSAMGIGEGDEVIVPANTFVATAFAVSRLGAVPVFADCDALTWQMDPASVESRITGKTRAMIGVHLYGQAFPVDDLKRLAKQYGLFLLEDCAQSQGTVYRGKTVGTLSDAGCFSFYPSKNLGACGQAGGVASADDELDQTIRILRSQGSREPYVHEQTGYNMRLDGIQAAVLSVKLRYLQKWNRQRAETVRRYREEISNPLIQFQGELADTVPAWYLAVVCVPDRQSFMEYMEKKGIRCGCHYPVPCHLQPAYRSLGYRSGELPNAEFLAEHCVSLPLFPELSEEEMDRVIKACNAYSGEV
ncbi:MAG: DegT/DnrJ/EryC1/StrS family aminotransferase [Oscillospiraceae bacterium]|nr:DegT/DnrJ/EryC1/StrS family aminotransferase [Oscillospiraceae bacterium]